MFREAEAILRGEGRHDVRLGRLAWPQLLALLIAGAFLYGMAMGSFGMRGTQAFYSGLKVPLLLLVSTCVCLPNFYVINSVLGLRDDFLDALRGVLVAQATVAICLGALAPVILFSYASSSNYRFAVLINGPYFLLATLGGQMALTRHYRPLVLRNPRHRLGRLCWVWLYIFVAIQLAWVLRPFIGSPTMDTSFFRQGAWSNAYVTIAESIWKLLSGG